MSLDSEIRKIAVFGLGKLGACIAAALAARGFEVIGFDVDRSKVQALARRQAPVDEPRLQETILEAGDRLRTAGTVADAVNQSEAAFFVPATPSLPDGSFDNKFLLQALRAVAEEVRPLHKRRYLFVVNSTVTPGSCDGLFTPLLEEVIGGKRGTDFGLCYNPEFIALGNVIQGLLAPDFVLIGESDPQSGQLLAGVYERFCRNSPPRERMSNLNAEWAKISVNSFVTMRISFVNQLAAVCARIPGADPGVILAAIGKDHRIGQSYLKPGLGYGGPCFPRDNRLFRFAAESARAEAPLAAASDRINDQVNQRLLDTVLAHAPNGTPVGVLGLAYKPDTSVIERSPGVWLSQQLAERGCRVLAHDYAAGANAASVLNSGLIRVCADPHEVFENRCAVLVITCAWAAYPSLIEAAAPELAEGTVIIDPWRMLAGVADRLRQAKHITFLF